MHRSGGLSSHAKGGAARSERKQGRTKDSAYQASVRNFVDPPPPGIQRLPSPLTLRTAPQTYNYSANGTVNPELSHPVQDTITASPRGRYAQGANGASSSRQQPRIGMANANVNTELRHRAHEAASASTRDKYVPGLIAAGSSTFRSSSSHQTPLYGSIPIGYIVSSGSQVNTSVRQSSLPPTTDYQPTFLPHSYRADMRPRTENVNAAERFGDPSHSEPEGFKSRTAPNPVTCKTPEALQNADLDALGTHVRCHLLKTEEFSKDVQAYHKDAKHNWQKLHSSQDSINVAVDKMSNHLLEISELCTTLAKSCSATAEKQSSLAAGQTRLEELIENQICQAIKDMAQNIRSTKDAVVRAEASDSADRQTNANRHTELLTSVGALQAALHEEIYGVRNELKTFTAQEREHRRFERQRSLQEEERKRKKREEDRCIQEEYVQRCQESCERVLLALQAATQPEPGSTRQATHALDLGGDHVPSRSLPTNTCFRSCEDDPYRILSPQGTNGIPVLEQDLDAQHGQDGNARTVEADVAIQVQTKTDRRTFPIRPVDDDDVAEFRAASPDPKALKKKKHGTGKRSAPRKYGGKAKKRLRTTEVEAQVESDEPSTSHHPLPREEEASTLQTNIFQIADRATQAIDPISEGQEALSLSREAVISQPRKGRLAAKARKRKRPFGDGPDVDVTHAGRVAQRRRSKEKVATPYVHHSHQLRSRGTPTFLPEVWPLVK